ncbi:hypothetical protein M409DRAFT_61716 [Zasmidium cellare ATCC 36951]|uniref:Enoyl reductase (ER) domain-containing protein n=1 Tax=Zasmidium cellare ATCC 36951 TaxID=1080233 RepID=A0A6A6BV34_ZASCE|nr:uncharacterized protein M409DRAFT_61716 [Zasmidium cellare ATCC 36951]KAF2158373.1 hypothetical protein M409DRAFT_61716 [Zasmidium cellare ATCC 36951]
MLPQTYRQYVVRDPSEEAGRNGFSSLALESVAMPAIGEKEVLVRVHAVSLNFRDIMIATGTYIWPVTNGLVPCSDGAGEVVAIGSAVTRVREGQRVMATFHQTHISGPVTPEDVKSGLGASLDGTLREYAVFPEDGLVLVPSNLDMFEASTLPCGGLTAWNALTGASRKVTQGDVAVVQGTGSVSIFAAQFGIASGAKVIATTSSEAKEERLRQLGVHHTINYRQREEWADEVRRISPRGADYVVEIGGPGTFEQTLKSIAMDGVISVIGQRTAQAGAKSQNQLLLSDVFRHPCTMRRFMVGSRDQFEEMNDFIAKVGLKPNVDAPVWDFEDAPKAFEHLWAQKHFGNVVIRVFRDGR